MSDIEIPQGEQRVIEGQVRVYYDGYWIKKYDVPADTLLAKKRLIEALTHRLFNHVEYGLNVPGTRLTEARRAFLGRDRSSQKTCQGRYAGRGTLQPRHGHLHQAGRATSLRRRKFRPTMP